VARGIHDKLVTRHPHVFADVQADDSGTVMRNWEQIKRSAPGYRPKGVAQSMALEAWEVWSNRSSRGATE
jgi:uncharacterized protein YabN with tetrapyrrole methylase and pyrophosphatase domain